MTNVSIRGLDKAAVLAALYNAAQPQGAGFLQYDPTPMTTDQAKEILANTTRFDYTKGRVMKFDLDGDEIYPGGYDRDNGDGVMQKVIDSLRASGDVNNPIIAGIHNSNAKVQAMQTKARLGDKTTMTTHGNRATMRMGLDDLAPHLAPRVDKVING